MAIIIRKILVNDAKAGHQNDLFTDDDNVYIADDSYCVTKKVVQGVMATHYCVQMQ